MRTVTSTRFLDRVDETVGERQFDRQIGWAAMKSATAGARWSTPKGDRRVDLRDARGSSWRQETCASMSSTRARMSGQRS